MHTNRTLATCLIIAAATLAATCTPGCKTKEKQIPSENAAALTGQTIFKARCIECHRPSALSDNANQIISNLGALASRMNDITLTDEEITNLKAYLATQ